MSMTEFQFEGLRRLGYTRRESEFLFLVATHSGYFTTHQFKSFMQTESGSVSHAFIRKLLERKHATYHAYRSGERVYHLFARKVYQAIERENLRTRKKHEVEYIKTRLVTLDFVLAHPEHRYLEAEAEKVAFFEQKHNVPRETLPVKLYRARRSADVTPRYFVDRFPIFLCHASSPPALTFTYVDSGSVTLGGFGTHLRAYLGLFQALPKFNFIFVAPSPRLFRAAEVDFEQIVFGRLRQGNTPSVLEYFRLRKAWDGKKRVASADVVLLKEAQSCYAGKQFDGLYERWRKGSTSESDVKAIAEGHFETATREFRTLVCGASLKVFADPQMNVAESSVEGRLSHALPQVSGNGSVNVSES